MIRLEAFTPEDGWAIVQDGEAYFLLRPPYRQADRHLIRASDAERAVTQEGFTPREDLHPDWGTLVRALIDERWKNAGQDAAEKALKAAEQILRRADAETLIRHLGTIEDKLLAERKWEEAQRALWPILQAPAMLGRPDLLSRGLSLLQRAMSGAQARPLRPDPRAAWFQDTSVASNEETDRQIARRGLLFRAA